MPPRKRLGQLLTELKVIDDHQLQSALGHQRQWGGKLGAILVQKGFCGEEQLVSALAQHLAMERVKLGETKIDPRAVKLVSKPVAEKLHVFPYQVTGAGRSEVISIAMSDPTDLSAVDQLAFHTGKRIKPLLASDSEIVSAIQAHYGATEEKKESTDKVARPAGSPAAAPAGFPKRIEPQAPAAPAAAAPRPVSPFPPPTPVPPAAPAPSPQPAEQARPPQPEAPEAPVAAAPVPVDLPEDDAEDLGLEPIAAHSQFGDAVSGQEEVAGEGNAADTIEGLVSASLAHEGAEQARAASALGGAGTEQPGSGGGESWGEPSPGFLADAAGSTDSWPQLETGAPAPPEQAWGTPLKTDEASWGSATPPAEPASDWGASPGDGWNMEEPSTSAGWSTSEGEQAWTPEGGPAPEEEPPSEALPTDAILGAVQEFAEDPEESGGAGWDTEEPPAGAAAAAEPGLQQGEESAGLESAAQPEPLAFAESQPDEAPAGEGESPAETVAEAADSMEAASSEDAGSTPELAEAAEPVEVAGFEEPSAGSAPEPSTEMPAEPRFEAAAAETPEEPYPAAEQPGAAREPDTEPIPEPPAYAVPGEQHEAEPPDAWAASDDPLAAEAAPEVAAEAPPDVPAWEGSAGEAGATAADLSTAEFANPLASAAQAEPPPDVALEAESVSVEVGAAAFEVAVESAAAEAPAEAAEAPGWQPEPEESVASVDPLARESTERFARQDEPVETWTPAPQEQPQAPAWSGGSLEGATPLSPADLGTLTSIGVDPGDGVGALRLLAALVRILNRGQLIEPDDLRAEIRESREAAAAAAAQSPNGVESEGSSSGHPDAPGTTAET
jgi:outer membrane biosynthesis protein TonB